MKNVVILLAGTLLFARFSFGQAGPSAATGSVSGYVADELAKPAGFASVSVVQAKDSALVKGTITSEAGTYTLHNIPDGRYLICVSMMGYKVAFSPAFAVSPATQQALVPTLQLQKTDFALKEVAIVAAKPLIERKIDRTVMNVENSVLATGNNALDILQRAPGVTIDRDDRLTLRGKSGVQVMVDGKLTHLSQDQLSILLRSTEGQNIQAIEIITNPSAKFDAAGNAGIINIRLKKNQSYGTNGSASISGGYGQYHKASSSLSLNHRTKNLNLFGTVSHTNNKNFHSLDINRSAGSESGQAQYIRQQTRSTRPYQSSTFKLGADYTLNAHNLLGVMVTGNLFRDNTPTTGLTTFGNQGTLPDSSVVANNAANSRYSNVAFNVNYKSVLDSAGQELTVDLDYSRPSSFGTSLYTNRYLDSYGSSQRSPYLFRNETSFLIDIYAFKADYTYPLNKTTKLEAGIKSSRVKTDNLFQYDKAAGTNFVNVPDLSNWFIYSENINASYLNFSKEFSRVSVQIGLRAEHTNSNGNSVNEQKRVDRSYLNLFPTAFVNYQLAPSQEVGFSFSRRIDRPDYSSLNPFITYIDQYLYSQGNPFLNPQYTNSYEVVYAYKKTYSATVGYSRTSDLITQVMLPDSRTNGLYQTMANLAEQDGGAPRIT
jgi:outer membrane receptor protein involved in Fe transport